MYLYIPKLVHRPRFPILYISLLYQYDYYTSTTGGTTPVPDATQQGILSMTIYSISMTTTTVRPVVPFLYHPMTLDKAFNSSSLSMTRHCRSCTVMTITTTHFASVVCLVFCPCPAPRVYPLPARTSRRLRGGRRLTVTVTSLAGGRRGP